MFGRGEGFEVRGEVDTYTVDNMSSDAEPQKDATTAPVRIQLRKEIDKDTQKEHYVREIIPMPPPPPSSILPIFRYIPKSMHPILDYFPYSSPEEREFLVHTKNRALVFGSVGSLLFASASIFTRNFIPIADTLLHVLIV